MIELPAYVPYLIAALGMLLGFVLHLVAVMWMTAQHARAQLARQQEQRTCSVCDQPAIGTCASMEQGVIRMAALCADHLQQATEFHQRNHEED